MPPVHRENTVVRFSPAKLEADDLHLLRDVAISHTQMIKKRKTCTLVDRKSFFRPKVNILF